MRSTLNHRREVINLSDILTLGLAKQLSQLLLTQSQGFDVPGGDSGGHDVLGNALWTVSAGQRKPIRGLALRDLSSVISSLMASNTWENCSS